MSSISGPEHLSGHHRDTLQQIFQKKTNHNVEWHDVVSLLEEVGSIEQQHDDMFLFRIGQETEVLRRPSEKDIDGQQLVDLRRILTTAGYDTMAADLEAKGVAIEGQGCFRVVMWEEGRVNGDVHGHQASCGSGAGASRFLIGQVRT